MAYGLRKSKRFGPFRVTLSGRGVTTSVGGKRARVSTSTSGRKTGSVRLAKGLIWRRTRG